MALLIPCHQLVICASRECSNEAISMGDKYGEMPTATVPSAGHYDTPPAAVRPIRNDDPERSAHVESEEQLWDKFVLMHHADKI
ncbi:ferredoxin [Klebsiella pneumoniae]|nr:ferredoxin [Klebsiella pneumoniae]